MDWVRDKQGKSFLYDELGQKRPLQILHCKDNGNNGLSVVLQFRAVDMEKNASVNGPLIPVTIPCPRNISINRDEFALAVQEKLEQFYVSQLKEQKGLGGIVSDFIRERDMQKRGLLTTYILEHTQKAIEKISKEELQAKRDASLGKNMSGTLVVNLLGGPGCGKSTAMAGVFNEMKVLGVNAEECSEWIKEKVYDGDAYPFENQIYTFAQQLRKQDAMDGKVDYIVSDSPLILSAFYGSDKYSRPEFNELVLAEFKRFNNLNVFIERPLGFQEEGRVHSQDESVAIDKRIKEYMNKHKIPFVTVQADKDIVQNILHAVAEHNGDMRLMMAEKEVVNDAEKYHRKVFTDRVTIEPVMIHGREESCVCVQFTKIGKMDGAKVFIPRCQMTNSLEKGKKVLHFPKNVKCPVFRNGKDSGEMLPADVCGKALYEDQKGMINFHPKGNRKAVGQNLFGRQEGM